MKAILFYQHAVRELESSKRLSSMLLDRGFEVDVFQIDFEWAKAVRKARRTHVDAVIMPWIYQDMNYALLTPFLSVNPGLVVINLHHEQISTPAYEPILLPSGEPAMNGCYHVAWGDFFACKLIERGVRKDLVMVTGNMRTDDVVGSSRGPGRDVLSNNYGLNPNKRWLLYAENRGWVYKFDDAYRQEYESQGVRGSDITRNLEVSTLSLEATYRQIGNLGDDFAGKFELIYRPHPGTTTPFESRGCVHVIGERPISDWIGCSDVLVTWSSTSAYEAEMAGLPVVRHMATDCPDDLMIFGMEAFPAVGELEEITPEFVETLRERHSEVYKEFYGEVDGHATERVADAIAEAVRSGMPTVPAFELDAKMKKALARKWAFEVATRISAGTRLLGRTHWPRSAWYQRTDLPY